MNNLLGKIGFILIVLFVIVVFLFLVEVYRKIIIDKAPSQQEPISVIVDPSTTIELMNQCARLILKVVIGDIKDFYCTLTSSNNELYLAVYGPDDFGKTTQLIQKKVPLK